MKKLRFLLLLLFVPIACTDTAETASRAAERYYACLIEGDVDRYLRAMADYDEMPDEYRGQLRDLFLQYLEREQSLRGGLVAAHATRESRVDSLHTHVFVDIQFGDSTHEEVSLPLVLTDKGWRLK